MLKKKRLNSMERLVSKLLLRWLKELESFMAQIMPLPFPVLPDLKAAHLKSRLGQPGSLSALLIRPMHKNFFSANTGEEISEKPQLQR